MLNSQVLDAYKTLRHVGGPLHHCNPHGMNQPDALINQMRGPLTTFDRSTGVHRTVVGRVFVHAQPSTR